MKKIAFLGALSALALTPGCGGGRGGSDAGGIVLMDSGPGMMGTDAGPGMMMGTDAGGGGSSCSDPLPDLIELNMDPAAMGMLLPRCAAATQSCLAACTDNACLTGCLSADTTPGVDVGGGTIIDCNVCFNIQFNKCLDNACHSQFAAFLCCAEAMGCTNINACPACSTENDALTSCASSSGISLASCASLTDGCFP